MSAPSNVVRRRRPTKPTRPLPNPRETMSDVAADDIAELRRRDAEAHARFVEEDRREEHLAMSALVVGAKLAQEAHS